MKAAIAAFFAAALSIKAALVVYAPAVSLGGLFVVVDQLIDAADLERKASLRQRASITIRLYSAALADLVWNYDFEAAQALADALLDDPDVIGALVIADD